MLTRRTTLASGAALLAVPAIGRARAADAPLRIGSTVPYSGPASAYGVIGKTNAAFFRMINDQGGVGGRQIDFISYDDGYNPARTVEQVRRLVEQDHVDFLFDTLGTPTNSAIVKYCNQRKIPQVFVATGADKWGDYKQFPWTIGWQPSYRTEAQIYTKYLLKQNPGAKLAILYQNDDFGKDYVRGVRDVLGASWDKTVVKVATYEITDPTVESQITSLQSSGADALLVAATPKFVAQAIREVHQLNWKPMFFLTNVSISIGAVMRPAGPENALGIISATYLKNAGDPAWKDDPGMRGFLAFMAKHIPSGDVTDGNYIAGYGLTWTMWKVLEACAGDFSRPSIMKHVTNIHDMEVPVLLPGIKVNTSPTNYHPIVGVRLVKWDGKTWVGFGEIIEGVRS